ncbi:transposase [Streptomyces sp. NPDC001212]
MTAPHKVGHPCWSRRREGSLGRFACDRWWPEIEAFIATGHSNAKSEGIHRMIKLTARAAHGFRNPANQRLRTCCVTTRRVRGHLRTAQL